MLDGCPPDTTFECEKLDLVIVTTLGNGSVWADAKAAINSALDDIDVTGTSNRYGLISVDASGNVTVEEALALNNLAAVKTAVTALPDGTYPGQTPTDEYAHGINGGLEEAINTGGSIGTWRTGNDISRQIVLLSDMLPGGNNDTWSQTDEDELIQAATDGWSDHEIQTHCLRGHLWTGTYLLPVLETQVDAIYRATATAGNGSFASAILGSGVLYATLRKLVEIKCYADGGAEGNGYDDPDAHLICCRTSVCTLCLEFVCAGQNDVGGFATWNGHSYLGLLDTGEVFEAYWAIRDKCYFFVEIDGVVHYVVPKCPDYGEDGTDCREPEGSFDWTQNLEDYDECSGVLTFRTYKPTRLKRISDGSCSDYFCGQADCTCEKLCVVVSQTDGDYCEGVWDLASYENCEIGITDPQWAGTSECTDGNSYTGRIYLKRDDYTGDCVMYGTITDVGTGTSYALPEVFVDGDTGSVADWDLSAHGFEVTAKCQVCGKCGAGPYCCECRFDNLAEFTGTVTSGGRAGCVEDIPAVTIGNGTGGHHTTITEANKRWVDSDCVHSWSVTFTQAPNPPGCTDPDTDRVLVVVQRSPDQPAHPLVDDSVEPCEWYLVVYKNGSPVDIVYSYDQCCENLEQGPASSFLKYLTFYDASIGTVYGTGAADTFTTSYTMDFRNVTTIASRGVSC